MDFRQKQRSEYRSLPYGYYHLCTDGWKDGKLFHTKEQFAFCMAGLALLTIVFHIQIYACELMPNHIHIILSGTGEQCLKCFYYLVRRINKKLRADGLPDLPKGYWMKIVPIEDRESMRHHLVYLSRNMYEKGECTPCGHMWGTGYLLYNQTAPYIVGTKVKDMPVREVERLVGSRTALPPEWEIHPELGILPKCFVNMEKVMEMFPSVKDYMTLLVKGYESYVRISDSLNEDIQWSETESKDILYRLCDQMFPQKKLFSHSHEEKCRIAVQAHSQYRLPLDILSDILSTPEYVLRQTVNSKDYGYRKR